MAEILGKRQPYISQQLMVLRDANLVTTERQAKNIYYQLKKENLSIIRKAIREICEKQTDTSEDAVIHDMEVEK